MKTIEITVLDKELEKIDYLKAKYDTFNKNHIVEFFIEKYRHLDTTVNNVVYGASFMEGCNSATVYTESDGFMKFKFEDID